MVAGTHGLGDFDPLLLGRVDTGRVVGASVEDEDGEMGSRENGSDQAIVVETTGINIEVRVVRDSGPNVLEDLVVVGPGWDGKIERGLWSARVETGEEQPAKVDSTSSGNSLDAHDLDYDKKKQIEAIVSLPISIEKQHREFGERKC